MVSANSLGCCFAQHGRQPVITDSAAVFRNTQRRPDMSHLHLPTLRLCVRIAGFGANPSVVRWAHSITLNSPLDSLSIVGAYRPNNSRRRHPMFTLLTNPDVDQVLTGLVVLHQICVPSYCRGNGRYSAAASVLRSNADKMCGDWGSSVRRQDLCFPEREKHNSERDNREHPEGWQMQNVALTANNTNLSGRPLFLHKGNSFPVQPGEKAEVGNCRGEQSGQKRLYRRHVCILKSNRARWVSPSLR